MITPLEIQNWLKNVVTKKSFGRENTEYLKQINKSAYDFLENENQKLAEPYDNDEDYFEYLWTFRLYRESYWDRTVEAYLYSLHASAMLINLQNQKLAGIYYNEWLDEINSALDGSSGAFRWIAEIANHLNGSRVISEDEYLEFRLRLSNYQTEFINEFFTAFDRGLDKDSKKVYAVAAVDLKIVFDRLGKMVSIENVFPRDSRFWPDFYIQKALVNFIDSTVNKSRRGRKSLISKCGISEKQFAQDINKYLFTISKNKTEMPFSTYELAGHLMTKPAYQSTDENGDQWIQDQNDFNKFVRGFLNNKWGKYMHENEFPAIVQYGGEFILIGD